MSRMKNFDQAGNLDEQELEELYIWVDRINLSRPKRNITRDFSDGVLVAEVIKHELPKLVDVHNYSPANATPQKMQNWCLLNRKVFKLLNFELSEEVMRNLSNCKAGMIENFLYFLRSRIDQYRREKLQEATLKAYQNERPEADQNTATKTSPRKDKKTASTHATGGSEVVQGHKQSKNDVVPLLLLEEKEQEVLAKNETIQILQAKIKRLEHLLHLKDLRIEDLQSRLESTRATGRR